MALYHFILLLLVLVIVSLLFYIILPHYFKKRYQASFFREYSVKPFIYLTFDDGPHQESTPQVLDILKKRGVKATFFVTGKNALEYLELTKRILNEGHKIGSHGHSHLHAWKTGPLKTLIDWNKSNRVFQNIIKNEELYRPPYGKFNLITLILYYFSKKKVIFWNIDPKDYECTSPVQISDHVAENLNPGSVILLHDGRSKPKIESETSITVDSIDSIIDNALKKGLQFDLL